MNKTILLILSVLLILQVSIYAKRHSKSSKYKSYNPHLQRLRLQRVKTADDKNKTAVIPKADEIFNKDPQGMDKYEEILEGDVMLLNTKTSSINPK